MSGNGDKMFRVIVLGGLALVSYEACGGTVTAGDAGSDGSVNPDSFPSELPVQVEASLPDVAPDVASDAKSDASDAGSDG